MTTFVELGVDQDIVDALSAKGIVDAFPIQEQTIPLGLPGQDIIGQAKTGTGKTFGFGIPVVQRLGIDPAPGVKALIVVPTRELAVQVYEDMDMLTSNRATSVVAIYGGKAYEGQIDQLKAGAQIVVGTPGRLIDLNNQRLLDLSNATEVVLDEADKMLDLGFLPDIEKIFSKVAPVRHTQLFSATMPGPIVALARRFMSNPIHIRATDPDEGLTQANIRHLVYRAHSLDKDEVIARILQAEGRGKTVVFTRTKRAAQRLVDELNDRGFNAGAVHGDMSQESRERSMAAFKAGKKDILIATDVAARGIDVDDVTHVINHTIPDDEKTYLHRAGRTGRAGKTGIAVTFVDWEDLHKWALINRALEFGQPEPVETYSSSPHLFEELDIPAGTKGRIATAPKTQTIRTTQPARAAEAAAEGTSEGERAVAVAAAPAPTSRASAPPSRKKRHHPHATRPRSPSMQAAGATPTARERMTGPARSTTTASPPPPGVGAGVGADPVAARPSPAPDACPVRGRPGRYPSRGPRSLRPCRRRSCSPRQVGLAQSVVVTGAGDDQVAFGDEGAQPRQRGLLVLPMPELVSGETRVEHVSCESRRQKSGATCRVGDDRDSPGSGHRRDRRDRIGRIQGDVIVAGGMQDAGEGVAAITSESFRHEGVRDVRPPDGGPGRGLSDDVVPVQVVVA